MWLPSSRLVAKVGGFCSFFAVAFYQCSVFGELYKLRLFSDGTYAALDRTGEKVVKYKQVAYEASIEYALTKLDRSDSPNLAGLDYLDWMVLGTHYSREKNFSMAALSFYMGHFLEQESALAGNLFLNCLLSVNEPTSEMP
eukprot:Sdes_comp20102_c0_seq1m13100